MLGRIAFCLVLSMLVGFVALIFAGGRVPEGEELNRVEGAPEPIPLKAKALGAIVFILAFVLSMMAFPVIAD